MAGIVYTDYFISEAFLTVEDVVENGASIILPEGFKSVKEYSATFKVQTGLDKISDLSKVQIIDKYDEMFSRFFEKTEILANEIAYFVAIDLYSNASTDISICSYLQKKYKVDNATMFSLHQGCGSTLVSMGMAQKLLSEKQKYMVIISSCLAPSFESRYIGTTVVGDALGLMVIGYDEQECEIVDYISVSDGQISYDAYHGIEFKPDVISVVIKGTSTIKKLIAKNDLSMKDIELVIPQSINYQKYSGIYAKMLGIESNKMYLENIAKGGHLGDADIIRNLHEYRLMKEVLKEGYVLLYGIGGPQGKDKSYNAVLVKMN